MNYLERPDKDTYFMNFAITASTGSTCLHRKVGAVAIFNKHILATGYNGSPSGFKHCSEIGCLRDTEGIKSGTNQEVCRGVHAEQNVIIQASLHENSLEGSMIYCTHSPCRMCAKMLVNAKISEFIYREEYSEGIYQDLFDEANIKIRKI